MIYITKYALTKGVIAKSDKSVKFFDDDIKVIRLHGTSTYYYKPDWHTSKEEAIARVKEMKKKKLISLTKQLEKIGAIDPESLF